jgi:hypothetical protein
LGNTCRHIEWSHTSVDQIDPISSGGSVNRHDDGFSITGSLHEEAVARKDRSGDNDTGEGKFRQAIHHRNGCSPAIGDG